MPTTLDQALSAVTATEAALAADTVTVSNIKASISTASAPLPDAQAKVSFDVEAFNTALDSVIVAATAAKIPVPPPVPAS